MMGPSSATVPSQTSSSSTWTPCISCNQTNSQPRVTLYLCEFAKTRSNINERSVSEYQDALEENKNALKPYQYSVTHVRLIENSMSDLASSAGSRILDIIPYVIHQTSSLNSPLNMLDISRRKTAVLKRNRSPSNRAQSQQ